MRNKEELLDVQEIVSLRGCHRQAVYQAIRVGRVTPKWKLRGHRKVLALTIDDAHRIKADKDESVSDE